MISTLVVLATLTGADVYSYAGAREDTAVLAQVLAAALPGAKDVTKETAQLRSEGLLPFPDFMGFRAPLPAGWPESVGAAWSDDLAQCARIAGPPPWRGSLLTTFCCAQRAAKHLQRQWLDARKVTRAVELEVVDLLGQCEVRGVLLHVPSASMATLRRPCGSSKKAAAAALVEELVNGKLALRPWDLPAQLSGPLSSSPLVGKLDPSAPPPKAPRCDAAPKALQLADQSPIAKALVERWAKVAAGAGAPVTCTLESSRHREVRDRFEPTQDLDVVATFARCGDVEAFSEIAELPNPALFGRAVDQLLTGLATKWCAAPARP